MLAIVSEVEFVPMYLGQPLFGDVCAFLSQHDLMFHKFLGLAGRALKPIVLRQNPNAASQHMWSDTVFVRHLLSLPGLASEQLLKISVLACLYGSPDLSHFCLEQYDLRHGTDLAPQFLHPVR